MTERFHLNLKKKKKQIREILKSWNWYNLVTKDVEERKS